MKKKLYVFLTVILYILILSVSDVFAVNCSALPNNVTIDIDNEPYVSEMITFFGVLPVEHNSKIFKCLSYVKKDGEVLQTNPQKTSFSQSKIPLFAKREEPREYFDSHNGVVNAYFTYKELVGYTEFELGLYCVTNESDVELIGEKCITPQYKELKQSGTRGVWAVNNAEMIFVLFIAVIIIVLILGFFYRKLF